jgi:hypothetical protein
MTLARSSLRLTLAGLVAIVIGATPLGLHAAGNSLSSGASLNPGDSLTSPSGTYNLIYQSDGNLVVYRDDGTPVWWSSTNGSAPGLVTVQTGGDVTVTDPNGNILWSAGTDGNPGDALVMQDSGALQVIGSDGTVLWDSGSGGGTLGDCGGFGGGNTLDSGQVLCTNTSMTSPSGTFFLIYQDDGNFVLYRNDGTPVWWTGTDGTSAGRVSMEAGGALAVIAADGTTLWTSGTDGNPGAELTVQDDGSANIIGTDGSVLWTTGPH